MVHTLASVEDQVQPIAVQLGLELTDSPPLSPQECVQIKSGLAFEHVVDRPGSFVSEDGQGFTLAVCFLEAREQCLRGGIIPQA